MPHLEAASSLHDVIAATLDFCVTCRSPLSKADDNYVTCLTCDGALCRECHTCPCDVYGVPESDTCVYLGEAELLALFAVLQKS